MQKKMIRAKTLEEEQYQSVQQRKEGKLYDTKLLF